MAYISSIGLGIPENEILQDEVKKLVKYIFPYNEKQLDRLMPVYDHALIEKRQLVVEKDWFKDAHTFQERNELYQKFAVDLSLEAIDQCLANKEFLSESIPHEAVDMIAFVSSTGIATPSLDAHLFNNRPFRSDVARMPLWGLGCAGGATGLSRVYDWICANPTKTAVLVCCELCSLTFQNDDASKSNIVGTALFGDGVAASLLIGNESPYRNYSKMTIPKIKKYNSHIEKNTLSVMGWDVTNTGLGVIFSKSIPKLVESLWNDHITNFLASNQLSKNDIHSFIAHPGGKKVLEAMKNIAEVSSDKFHYSYQVLKNHGNMSSATVLYVLYEWMRNPVPTGEFSILSALGPGFSSELLLLEWEN